MALSPECSGGWCSACDIEDACDCDCHFTEEDCDDDYDGWCEFCGEERPCECDRYYEEDERELDEDY